MSRSQQLDSGLQDRRPLRISKITQNSDPHSRQIFPKRLWRAGENQVPLAAVSAAVLLKPTIAAAGSSCTGYPPDLSLTLSQAMSHRGWILHLKNCGK